MAWYHRWRNVFRNEQLNGDLDAELQYHIAETVDRLVSEGMPEDQALREARRRLGNYSLQKERTRDMNISAWLDTTRADLHYGLRQLRLNPGFATVAILSLALGIGANSAIFQLVNAIRLKILPVRDPGQIVAITFDKGSTRGGRWFSRSADFTSAQFDQIRRQQQAFDGVIAFSASRLNLATGGEPRFAEAFYVSGDYFDVLGVPAALGRTFTAADDSATCNAGIVLSHAFWQREFGGDPSVLSRKMTLEGTALPIIGVTPADFYGVEIGNRWDLAVPLCADRVLAEDHIGHASAADNWWLSLMARLKPGWTVDSATAHLRTISPGIMQATMPAQYSAGYAKRFLANKLHAEPAATGISRVRADYERPLWLLMAATGLVLLIACANLANLLLARATVREREISVRLAIGASRFRLIRQLLAESLILAGAGTILGAALAALLSRALVLFISTSTNPLFIDVSLDTRALLFTVALAVSTCLLFGLLPAIRATFVAPASVIRAGGRGLTSGKGRNTIRRTLVATQVALSLVLLVGALLFTRSLHNLLTTDSGFRPQGVLTVGIDLTKASIAKDRSLLVYRELTEKFAALPGVTSAAQVGFTPVNGNGWDQNIGVDGAVAADSGKQAFFNRTAPGYFQTMGTRFLAGRDFDQRDNLAGPKVAIVNEAFSRKYYGGANPVGHTFRVSADSGKPEPVFQVVGMVSNTKYYDLREEFRPLAFFPVEQNESPDPGANFVLRVNGPLEPIYAGAKAAAAQINPTAGIEFRPFDSQLNESVLRERLMATLSVGFGLLAGLLSTLGLYGVIAYMVARRRSEIGVRMALGAGRSHVIGLVFREAVLLLAIGLSVGGVLALAAGRAATSLLYGLAPNDPVTLLAAGLLLTTIALLASYLPARRAAAIDPIDTLRNE